MSKTYSSFKEFFENESVEIHRDIETVVHNDENIANNRLFVWNFEEIDLEEFVDIFKRYKNSDINDASRQLLNSNLLRKMNSMIREEYNPVECMLYASKIINYKLENDKALQEILAERIKDVYIKHKSETIAVLENIIKMWTWVPQIKTVITAIGLIGDNQELLDSIMINYVDDANYKSKVFYSLMRNKSEKNLERSLKIIMNLQDNEDDMKIGRAFIKEFSGFGYEGIKLVSKYYENPGVSFQGNKILKKIMMKNSSLNGLKDDDELYRKTLASKSLRDDLAYKDFLLDCEKEYDQNAFYLCRFSRSEMGDFLQKAIKDNNLNQRCRNTAIVSLGSLGMKGYLPANKIINECEGMEGAYYSIIMAKIIMNDSIYVEKLIDVFCDDMDYKLSDLYKEISASGIASNTNCVSLIQKSIERRFKELVDNKSFIKLECLMSNIQLFWNKKLYVFLSKQMLDNMRQVMLRYADNTIDIPYEIIISIIETIIHSWNIGVEKAIFALYKNADNKRVQQLSFKKLKERKIEAPK